jgi:hypothetical protein
MISEESQPATGGDETSKEPQFVYKHHLAVMGVFVAVALGGACLAYAATYVGGLFNNLLVGFAVAVVFMSLLALLTLFFVVHGFFLLFKRPRSLRHAARRLPLVMMPLLAFVAAFLICTPLSPIFLRGLKVWTLRNVDIEAVQQWLATDGPAIAERDADQWYRHDFPDDYPKCLVEFKPQYIWFNRTPDGQLTVEFEWGGGLGHWGVIVGPRTMPTPKAGCVETGGSEVEFRRPVRPGVYVISRG